MENEESEALATNHYYTVCVWSLCAYVFVCVYMRVYVCICVYMRVCMCNKVHLITIFSSLALSAVVLWVLDTKV